MSDRILVNLNDRWALTSDALQWMVARRSGASLQARRFIRSKKGLLQAINASPNTDTIYVGPITEEARAFIEALPDRHDQWISGTAASPGTGASGEQAMASPRAGTKDPDAFSGSGDTGDAGTGEAAGEGGLQQIHKAGKDAADDEPGPGRSVPSASAEPPPKDPKEEKADRKAVIHVAAARMEEGAVLIPFAELQEDGSYRLRQARIRPPGNHEASDDVAARTRSAWIRKKVAEGIVVAETDEIERFRVSPRERG